MYLFLMYSVDDELCKVFQLFGAGIAVSEPLQLEVSSLKTRIACIVLGASDGRQIAFDVT